MIYNVNSIALNRAYNSNSIPLIAAYDCEGTQIFPSEEQIVPKGNMKAAREIALPDIYGTGHGFTCTGLAYDAETNTFLIGDIGKALPSSSGFASQIVRVSADFLSVVGTIPLAATFPDMLDIQGIAIDTTDGTIWFCSTEERKIRHIDKNGNSIRAINLTNKPTGVAYSPMDNSLWVLTYGTTNNILRIDKSGSVLEQYTFAYSATLDQCFLDFTQGYLYITAGDNYSGRNNIYMFDTSTHEQSIPCTVDSYAVEGIWIGNDRMVILNDGYYHSAAVPVNQANIYNLITPYIATHSGKSMWGGGYIEIQPDSWDGSTVVTGDIVDPGDATAWGFPMSLSEESKLAIKREVLNGNGFGISYIRFPMGFAYRGYRNIDVTTGLAKNIGQRWEGQNTQLASWLSDISKAGGGLSVEYWCPAPYWITGGEYYNESVENELWAGGNYPRTTTLRSIKTTDAEQYWSQIDEFTDAIVNDLEYVHQNIAPVRMYTLAAEPTGSGKLKYGHCHWTAELYNDVFEALSTKVLDSQILADYDGQENEVLMHLCADDTGFNIGESFINSHPERIWGFSHDVMRPVSGENGNGADIIKTLTWPSGSSTEWENVFICEYEYFNPNSKTDDFRFANNVVRLIFELCYRKARVIMPIIHICKPTGQSQSQTNTVGYCLYAVNMENGSFVPNTWAYNSWKMFNDNLPIGAEIISGGDGGQTNCGYVILKHGADLFVLLGNYSDTEKTVILSFDESLSLNGKLYSTSALGLAQATKTGKDISFTIPAYCGIVYTTNNSLTE